MKSEKASLKVRILGRPPRPCVSWVAKATRAESSVRLVYTADFGTSVAVALPCAGIGLLIVRSMGSKAQQIRY